MTVVLWGLKNCDSCRKARSWFDGQGIAYIFRDVRAEPIQAVDLKRWFVAHGDWEVFINRRGTTWRKLGDKDKEGLDADRAIALLAANPTLMKRPVVLVERDGAIAVTVGFGPKDQTAIAGFLQR